MSSIMYCFLIVSCRSCFGCCLNVIKCAFVSLFVSCWSWFGCWLNFINCALFPYLPAVGCWLYFINCALSPYFPAVGRGSVGGWDHVSVAAWISSIMYFVIFFQTSVVGRSSVGCWCNQLCILYLFISSQSWLALLDTIMLLFSNYSGIFVYSY